MRPRTGFTLLEILISIMIFSIVSIAMIGILAASVRLFRIGESARAGADESLAVLAQLDDDLKRMIPAADGGFLFTRTRPTNSKDCGNMALAFKIRNPDPTAINKNGTNARLIVVWWVDDKGWLNRRTTTAADSDNNPLSISEYTVAGTIYGTTERVAAGCLYFGVDLSPVDQPRSDLGAWLPHVPEQNDRFSTEPVGTPPQSQPFPTAIRVSLTLTGGNRNVSTGRVVRAEGSDDLRITGVDQVPVIPGAVARIGDPENGRSNEVEWVAYTAFNRGILVCANGREQRRTNRIADPKGEPIVFASSYSIVRTIPR